MTMNNILRRRQELVQVSVLAGTSFIFLWNGQENSTRDTNRYNNHLGERFVICNNVNHQITLCEANNNNNTPPLATTNLQQQQQQQQQQQPKKQNDNDNYDEENIRRPSWLRRNILAPIFRIPLPLPRLLTSDDPALKLSKRYIQHRMKDEEYLRKLIHEKGPSVRGNPEKAKALGQEIFEITYGKGVTPQSREDFLVRYGCTGWTDEILETLVDLCWSHGIVEIGAGHGQWARALSEAYTKILTNEKGGDNKQKKKQFDFVLAYDDMSNLPLNTHIYNPYTQPHHDYFGNVRELKRKEDTIKVLQSWACRGRALLLVYPPPGPMAIDVVKQYADAAPENDTIIFIGEGRGGANGDDALFDYLESGDWILLKIMNVRSPPGDKGYEKMFILKKRVVASSSD